MSFSDRKPLSRGPHGQKNNQAGIFEAEENKGLIPGRLARSPLNCLSTQKVRNESLTSVYSERLQAQCWYR